MIMLPVFKNSWFPTVFDDFMNNDMMACATTSSQRQGRRERLHHGGCCSWYQEGVLPCTHQ